MILIANIGNRNFTYRGMHVADFLNGQNTTFREFTKSLVVGDQEAQIELAILDTLLREYGNHIEKMYLIATNQKKGSNRDQDTHYAAELIKRKINISPEWKNIEVIIEELPISIERTEEVMNWYKRLLLKVHKTNLNGEYLICDAGGAPQMKTPLKIMSEFVLPVDRFSVKYVSQCSGEIIDVKQIEYRRVLSAYQIESILPTLNYHAGIKLWTGISDLPPDKDNVLILLQFGSARRQMLFEDARTFANKCATRIKVSKVDFDEYSKSTVHKMPNIQLAEDHIFQAKEYLYLADYSLEQNDLNNMVLYSRQFQEYMLAAILESYLQINLVSDYNNSTEQLKRYARSNNLKIGDYSIASDSVPARMVIAKTINDDEVDKWIKTFSSIEGSHSKGIGVLRNALVHSGKSVTPAKLKDFCPELSETIKLWKKLLLVETQNPYHILNSELVAALRG